MISHMSLDHLVEQIADFLSFRPSTDAGIRELETWREGSHERRLVRVLSEETEIPAFLFVPDGDGPFPAAVVFHQHAGERHLGKSEVAGLAGDPLQAFGPMLAALGFVVLAPDSIAFEDRRQGRSGLEADEDADWLEHFLQRLSVEGEFGLWIEGAPHSFVVLDADGVGVEESARLAANVLLWESNGVNHRLETSGDLQSALAIIETLER